MKAQSPDDWLQTMRVYAKHCRIPFDTWLIEDVLPEPICDAIAALPFAPPHAPAFDGSAAMASQTGSGSTSSISQVSNGIRQCLA